MNVDKQAILDENSTFSVSIIHHRNIHSEANVAGALVAKLSEEGYNATLNFWDPDSPVNGEVHLVFYTGASGKTLDIQGIVFQVFDTLDYSVPVRIEDETSSNGVSNAIRIFL